MSDFKILLLDYKSLFEGAAIVSVAASASFFLLKSYEGIIRFSEIHETMRALSAVFFSFLLMLVFNGVLIITKESLTIHNSVLFGYFFCASFVICGYRLLVKNLYQEDEETDVSSANVIIYGAEIKGSFLQKTLQGLSNKQFKVVAFIDDNEMLVGKTIDNIRIYGVNQLSSLLKPFRVKYLFFSQDVHLDLKVKIAEECMKYNVKLMTVPSFERWVKGNLNLNQLSDVKIEDLLGRPAIELCANKVVNFISGKNILITGAAGSIGSELARQIANMAPASLIICDQTETGLHDLEYELQQKYFLGNKLKPYLGDVKDVAGMDQLFYTYRPEIVFHAAAYKHVPVMENHPSQAIRNNVLGTKVLADLSEVYGVERFLFISTDKAINPTNIMGASKRLAEMYCHSLHHSSNALIDLDPQVYRISPFVSKTKFITTRFGNVLASNGSVIPRFREQIANGGPVTVTHPEIIRYFMTIQEACSLVLEAVTMGNGGEIFLFDMGEPVKILDLAKKMIRLAGYEPDKDIAIKFTGLRPGEKLYEELLNAAEKVIPTHHKKILIAKIPESNSDNVLDEIMKLIDFANDCKDEEVVKQMKLMLPEYISNNSVYQLYDNDHLPERTVANSL